MSLTSQLASRELGEWFRHRLSDPGGVREVLDRVQAGFAARTPVPAPSGRSAHDAVLVGLAVAQRFAFAVEPAPPYYALLGAHASNLVDPARAHAAAGVFPTHTPLPMVVGIRRLDRRPTPAGWIDAASPQPWKSYEDELFGPITLGSDPPSARDHTVPGHDGRCPAEVLSLCAWLGSALRDHARPGRLAVPNPDAPADPSAPVTLAAAATETSLAAACLALAGWEDAYRSRRPVPAAPVWDPDSARDGIEAIRAVLTAPDPDMVAEVEAITARAAASGTLTALRSLARRASVRVPLGRAGPVPLGFAWPVLVPHWADATAVVGDAGTPGGTTLLTLHAATGPPEPDDVLAWYYELVALAWLDAHDLYWVGNLALYLARHGSLITWPGTELAAHLCGVAPGDHERLDALREEFRVIARRAITADGADPRWAAPPPRPDLAATTGTESIFKTMRPHVSRTRG